MINANELKRVSEWLDSLSDTEYTQLLSAVIAFANAGEGLREDHIQDIVKIKPSVLKTIVEKKTIEKQNRPTERQVCHLASIAGTDLIAFAKLR